MKYGIFTSEGFPSAFYDSELHGKNIPSEAIKITDAQWLEFINNIGLRKLIDGEVIEFVPPVPPPTPADIDRERDRRISDGFVFSGVFYQSRTEDRENIAGAATAALAAMVNGAQPGNFRWHGGDADFVWIAADNTTHTLDAQSTFSLGQAAMAHKQAHIFAARTLKDMTPIPADYTEGSYWP